MRKNSSSELFTVKKIFLFNCVKQWRVKYTISFKNLYKRKQEDLSLKIAVVERNNLVFQSTNQVFFIAAGALPKVDVLELFPAMKWSLRVGSVAPAGSNWLAVTFNKLWWLQNWQTSIAKILLYRQCTSHRSDFLQALAHSISSRAQFGNCVLTFCVLNLFSPEWFICLNRILNVNMIHPIEYFA